MLGQSDVSPVVRTGLIFCSICMQFSLSHDYYFVLSVHRLLTDRSNKTRSVPRQPASLNAVISSTYKTRSSKPTSSAVAGNAEETSSVLSSDREFVSQSAGVKQGLPSSAYAQQPESHSSLHLVSAVNQPAPLCSKQVPNGKSTIAFVDGFAPNSPVTPTLLPPAAFCEVAEQAVAPKAPANDFSRGEVSSFTCSKFVPH